MKHIWTIVFVLILCGMAVFTAMTAGYAHEKYVRQDRCINAACEEPCDLIKKFKRHQGCFK